VILRWHVRQGIVAIPKSARSLRQAEQIDVFAFELIYDDVPADST
jgi:2,5-diketo-D-gluconate reductase A